MSHADIGAFEGQAVPLKSLRFAKRTDGSEVALATHHWQGHSLPEETQVHVYVERRRDLSGNGEYNYYCTLMEQHDYEYRPGWQSKVRVGAETLRRRYNLSALIPVTGNILGPMREEQAATFMKFAHMLSAQKGARYLKQQNNHDFGAPAIREIEAQMRIRGLLNELERPFRPQRYAEGERLAPLTGGHKGEVLALHA